MNNSVFWDVKPWCQVEVYRCFGGICCFQLQVARVSEARERQMVSE
jgi:hypothetical protein